MIDFNIYKNIIFDFDGTIVNSNYIKEEAINNAAKSFCEEDYLNKFVQFFTYNNGIPREEKINSFFNHHDAIQISTNYTNFLKGIVNIPLVEGAEKLIRSLSKTHKLFILSGGEKKEIEVILNYHNLLEFFSGIYTAPKNKYDNIKQLNLIEYSLFFGDSIIDYEVSKTFNCDFIFIYEYTQFLDWAQFFDKKNIQTIKNFKSCIEENKC